MSDTESIQHPTTGGKSLDITTFPPRQPYQSWRKKYRKMNFKFEGVLEENRRLFKDEKKLEGIAQRLREELDGVRELLLDLNESPALPPSLRFDISLPEAHTAVNSIPSVVADDITPDQANSMLAEYTQAVQQNQIPPLDLHVIRDQIDKKLALQGVTSLDHLESIVPHTRPQPDVVLPSDIQGPDPPSYLSTDQEEAHLQRIDAKIDPVFTIVKTQEKEGEGEQKHWADLTAREVERQVEVQNSQSAHNWLKRHGKQTGHADVDDNESLASHDMKPARGGGGKRNLAKQVGDRSVGRAREGLSPSAASFGDEDEFVDDHPLGKKRPKGDGDSTYRVKGGKGSASKGKRKRSSEDTPTGSGKKAKTMMES